MDDAQSCCRSRFCSWTSVANAGGESCCHSWFCFIDPAAHAGKSFSRHYEDEDEVDKQILGPGSGSFHGTRTGSACSASATVVISQSAASAATLNPPVGGIFKPQEEEKYAAGAVHEDGEDTVLNSHSPARASSPVNSHNPAAVSSSPTVNPSLLSSSKIKTKMGPRRALTPTTPAVAEYPSPAESSPPESSPMVALFAQTAVASPTVAKATLTTAVLTRGNFEEPRDRCCLLHSLQRHGFVGCLHTATSFFFFLSLWSSQPKTTNTTIIVRVPCSQPYCRRCRLQPKHTAATAGSHGHRR